MYTSEAVKSNVSKVYGAWRLAPEVITTMKPYSD